MITPEYVQARGLIDSLNRLVNGEPVLRHEHIADLEELGWVSNGVLIPIPSRVLGIDLVRDSDVNAWFGSNIPFSIYMAFMCKYEEIQLVVEVSGSYTTLFEMSFGPEEDVQADLVSHVNTLTSDLSKLKALYDPSK